MVDRIEMHVVIHPKTSYEEVFPLNEVEIITDDMLGDRRLRKLMDPLVEVTFEKLTEIADDVVHLVLRKNPDYGDSWQRQGIHGTLCRIADKLFRMDTLADGRKALVPEEKLSKTLIDNIGYSFLALLWLKEHGEFPKVGNEDSEG